MFQALSLGTIFSRLKERKNSDDASIVSHADLSSALKTEIHLFIWGNFYPGGETWMLATII